MKKLIFLLNIALLTRTDHALLNTKAPSFSAPCVTIEGKQSTFDLKEFAGKRVVLYFYPMDNTPGCTKQAKNFRDNIARLTAAGITVIAISCDSIKSHLKFQKKYHLPFMLVSDNRWKRQISKAYNAAGFLFSKRHLFALDENGIIIYAIDKVNIDQQVDNILAAYALKTQK